MRACVRNDDGRCSEGFEVTQGLRQGYVLSSLLFSVFFAAILLIALVNREIQQGRRHTLLAYLIQLQEQPSKVGPETALECVRHRVVVAARAGADGGGLRRNLRHILSDHLREQDGDHVHANTACIGNEDSPTPRGNSTARQPHLFGRHRD